MRTRRTVQVGLWVLLAVGFLLALAVVPTPAEAQQQASAVISTMTGRVEVLSKGQTAWQPARLGMPVFEGDESAPSQAPTQSCACRIPAPCSWRRTPALR